MIMVRTRFKCNYKVQTKYIQDYRGRVKVNAELRRVLEIQFGNPINVAEVTVTDFISAQSIFICRYAEEAHVLVAAEQVVRAIAEMNADETHHLTAERDREAYTVWEKAKRINRLDMKEVVDKVVNYLPYDVIFRDNFGNEQVAKFGGRTIEVHTSVEVCAIADYAEVFTLEYIMTEEEYDRLFDMSSSGGLIILGDEAAYEACSAVYLPVVQVGYEYVAPEQQRMNPFRFRKRY